MLRRFGVEIECNFPGGANEARRVLIKNGFNGWADRAEYEGSLARETGVEIRSPILRGRAGLNELKKVYELLNEHGFWMDNRCGMHVHHDAPEWQKGKNKELIRKFFLSWYHNQHHINKLVDPSRLNNGYCRQLTEYDLDYIMSSYSGLGDKAKSVNFRNLRTKGTIEIRQHQGTTDYDEAESWIIFGKKFIRHVLNLKYPLRDAQDTEALLRRIRVPVRVEGLYKEKLVEKNYTR